MQHRHRSVSLALAASLHTVALTAPSFAQPAARPRGAEPAGSRGDGARGDARGARPAAQGHDLIAKGLALFEDQQYEESIQTLSAALLRPNNTKEQRIEVYRLLALNYITLGRKDEAESAVRGLLVIHPDYQLPTTESPRFRDFFAQAQRRWDAEGRPGLAREEPQQSPATLKHSAPASAEASEPLTLRGKIDDPEGRVASVRLYYRTGTKGEFVEAAMEHRAGAGTGTIRAQVPGAAVKPPLVEYYMVARGPGGDVVANRGDTSSPLRVAVPEPPQGWVLPVAIGGGIIGAGLLVGGLALAGVFKASSSGSGGGSGNPNTSTVSVSVGETGVRFP